MTLHEGLEFNGPAPVQASIGEHPIFQDKYKGRKAELFSLASGILSQAIDRWQRSGLGSDLTKTKEMFLSEANPGLNIRGEDTVRSFYRTMEPCEIFEDNFGMFDGMSCGVKNSVEENLLELIGTWSKKDKGTKGSTSQNQYEKFLYLTSQLGINPREFLLDRTDETFELMGKVAEVIAILHLEKTREEISPEDFAAIAKSSFPIVEKLSKINTDRKPTFVDKAFSPKDWQKDPKTDYFRLETKDSITYLTLSPLGRLVYEQDGESEANLPSHHLFVRVDGNSPAEKIWHWMVDFLKEEELTRELVSQDLVDKIEKGREKALKVNV